MSTIMSANTAVAVDSSAEANGHSSEVRGDSSLQAEVSGVRPQPESESGELSETNSMDFKSTSEHDDKSTVTNTAGEGTLAAEHDDHDDDDDDDDDDDAVPTNEITVTNKEGESILAAVVRANDRNMIQHLVQGGWDCNAVCRRESTSCTVRVEREGFRKQLLMIGYTPLHLAAIHSSLRTVQCLLSCGAQINIRDKNQRTALQLACAVNRLSVARLLIDAGAEINTRSVSGRCPLMEAVTNVNVDLTRMLLEAGANADLEDIKGTTPLYAIVNAMAGMSPDRRAGQAIVQSLLDAGCEVDKTNSLGASALMLAAGIKANHLIPLLVEAGANVNLTDRAGQTAFSMAMEGQRNLTVIKTLMQYGAATHLADCKGATPLSKSLKYGSVTILRLLLSADAVPHSYHIMTTPRIVQLRQYLPEFDAWLHSELYEPRSLLRLCREVIRQQLSPHNLPQVALLDLPRSLNSFVLGQTD